MIYTCINTDDTLTGILTVVISMRGQGKRKRKACFEPRVLKNIIEVDTFILKLFKVFEKKFNFKRLY